jgi:hypothetical protein
MNRNIFLYALAGALLLVSCKNEEENNNVIILETDFNKAANLQKSASVSDEEIDGWKAVFAEYPENDVDFYELESGLKNLPTPLDQTKKAFMLSGNNHSDALQMFLVKQLSGLAPNTLYTIETEVEMASKYPDGSVGIGGSPGNAVHLVSKFATDGYTLKSGKNEFDNVELVLNKVESLPESVLNIDLGDVSIPSEEYVYQMIDRKKSSTPDAVVTDDQGKLWAIVGTWSGFEGISTLYYTRIKITLTEK